VEKERRGCKNEAGERVGERGGKEQGKDGDKQRRERCEGKDKMGGRAKVGTIKGVPRTMKEWVGEIR
jgi:hypothetical protein